MIYEIINHEGVGPLKFGMTRQEISEQLGGKPSAGHRGFSSGKSDAFESAGLFAYYDIESGGAIAFEFYERAPVKMHGQMLYDLNCTELLTLAKKSDPSPMVDDNGFMSVQLGIGIFAGSFADEPDCEVEGIIVFEKGYCDENGKTIVS